MNFDNGRMSANDFKTYSDLFVAMVETPLFPAPNLIIYLKTDLPTIIKRITERGREMEIATDISY